MNKDDTPFIEILRVEQPEYFWICVGNKYNGSRHYDAWKTHETPYFSYYTYEDDGEFIWLEIRLKGNRIKIEGDF